MNKHKKHMPLELPPLPPPSPPLSKHLPYCYFPYQPEIMQYGVDCIADSSTLEELQ